MRRQAHCVFWGVIRGEIHGGRCLSRAEPPWRSKKERPAVPERHKIFAQKTSLCPGGAGLRTLPRRQKGGFAAQGGRKGSRGP